MKNVILTLIVVLALASCRPEDFGSVGDPQSVITGIDGTWEISKVEVIDQTIPGTVTEDLSAFYTNQPNPMSIEVSSANNTYIVNNDIPGSPFGSEGDYLFNDPEFPTQLYLLPAGDTDTLKLNLGNMVRGIDPFMTLVRPTIGCDNPFALYNFTFKRT